MFGTARGLSCVGKYSFHLYPWKWTGLICAVVFTFTPKLVNAVTSTTLLDITGDTNDVAMGRDNPVWVETIVQSWHPDYAGWLCGITWHVKAVGTGRSNNPVVRIFEGWEDTVDPPDGNASLIFSFQIATSSIPTSESTLEFDFGSCIYFTPEKAYAIEIDAPLESDYYLYYRRESNETSESCWMSYTESGWAGCGVSGSYGKEVGINLLGFTTSTAEFWGGIYSTSTDPWGWLENQTPGEYITGSDKATNWMIGAIQALKWKYPQGLFFRFSEAWDNATANYTSSSADIVVDFSVATGTLFSTTMWDDAGWDMSGFRTFGIYLMWFTFGTYLILRASSAFKGAS